MEILLYILIALLIVSILLQLRPKPDTGLLLKLDQFSETLKRIEDNLRADFRAKREENARLAREWKVGKRSVLNIGGKLTMAGARRYSPMDTAASMLARAYIEQDSLKNTRSFGSAYFRVDFRLSYKINTKRFTHEFALDLANLSKRKNILKYSYSSEPPYYRQEYQLGFLPLFYYKLDF